MNDDHNTNAGINEERSRGFLASLFMGLVQEAVKLIIAFAIGTGVGAAVCWYYSIPLIISLLGGFLVLALALAFMSDSLFS